MSFLPVPASIRSAVQSFRRTSVAPVLTHTSYESLALATRPSVVCVESYNRYADKEYVISSGSGFLFGEEWIATSSLNVGRLPFCRVVTSDGQRVDGSVRWVDESVHLAVVQLSGKWNNRPSPLVLGSSSHDEVVAVTGVNDEHHLQFDQKREIFFPVHSLSAMAHWAQRMDMEFETEVYGQIGGPVVNTRSEVVAVAHVHDIEQPLGVPVEFLLYYMLSRQNNQPLKPVIQTPRSYGLLTFDFTRQFCQEFEVPISRFGDKSMKGVVLVYCGVGSPAYESGLRVDDVIVRINGEPADKSLLIESLENMLTVNLTVCRKGQKFSVQMPSSRWPVAKSSFQ